MSGGQKTYCISIILPEIIADGAKLSRLILKLEKPKNLDIRGEPEPRLWISENDACDWARGMSGGTVRTLIGRPGLLFTE